MRNIPKINGRRGVLQLLFSVVYLVLGISFFVLPGSASRADALHWLTQFLPIQPFACVWIAAALVGAVSALLPRPSDWRGFAALTLAPALWGFLFLIGVLLGAPPLGAISTLIYWLLAAIVIVTSDMQGPRDRDRRQVVL